jgi:hypothetical protein
VTESGRDDKYRVPKLLHSDKALLPEVWEEQLGLEIIVRVDKSGQNQASSHIETVKRIVTPVSG